MRAETLTGNIRSLLWNNLGHCTSCMNKSFMLSAASWALLLCSMLSGRPEFLLPAFVLSSILTMVWAAHVVVFAQRDTAKRYTAERDSLPTSRRAIFPLFVRAAAFGAFVSAMPNQALAACGGNYAVCKSDSDCCGGRVCSGGHCCCQ
jgi:hypothetical protein